MANTQLFQSTRGRSVPATTTTNDAGGKAYELSPEAALARYAMTGCLSNTFYVKAEDHLDRVLDLAQQCQPEFIGKLAVVGRQEGHMKDMPALLMAVLASRSKDGVVSRAVLKKAFPKVIDNGRMLRNFVQIMRSGQLGRKSLGTGPRNLVRGFFESNAPNWLFRQLSVGQSPSGSDIIKMVHPKAKSPEHEALFGYMIDKVGVNSEKWGSLPSLVKEFAAWKADRDLPPPAVPFQLLTAQPLTGEQWAKIFRNSGWHFVRMNLNTAIRQGALKADPGLEEFIADKLRDAETIRKARVMPYQIMAAYKHVSSEIPRSIVDALHDAMEISVENVPEIDGEIVVVVDVSGSMSSSISGGWGAGGMGDKRSKVRCVDVAALFSSAILRKNRSATVLPVDTQVYGDYRPEPRDSIMTNAANLARFGGGGTSLGLAFDHMAQKKMKPDTVIVISDQESWADSGYGFGFGRSDGTEMMRQWEQAKKGPNSKLICIDIVPGRTHQAVEGRSDILMVSGWNDSVFRVVGAYTNGDANSWLEVVEKTAL